jgi:Ca2+:H+ antiporter
VARNRVNRTGNQHDAEPEAGGPAPVPDRRSDPFQLAWFDPRQLGWESYLLLAVPVAIAASIFGAPPVVKFAAAGLAIVPLAGLMGRATEQLAHRLGPGVGGLLNATFGNAAELILALFALARGLDDVVKASLTGSIIGNLLLVLGASLFAGGLKFPIQRFNKTAASAGSTLMFLATVGLIIPALFHYLAPYSSGVEHRLSVAVCVVLVFTYGLSLIFSLGTHRDLVSGMKEDVAAAISEATWGLRHASSILLIATIFVAWMSEILVGAVEATSASLGLNAVFMGVVVVAIVGNAAEHSTAIIMALKNQMDLAVGIALGSALQVALFVAPVLVFASYLRETPMDLLFTTLELVAVILAVLVARMVAEDGESNWLEGAMLLMVYAILAVAFYYLPGKVSRHGAEGGPKPAAAAGHAGDRG